MLHLKWVTIDKKPNSLGLMFHILCTSTTLATTTIICLSCCYPLTSLCTAHISSSMHHKFYSIHIIIYFIIPLVLLAMGIFYVILCSTHDNNKIFYPFCKYYALLYRVV